MATTRALCSLQGQPVSLAAFAGKPTVVNLWATWCLTVAGRH